MYISRIKMENFKTFIGRQDLELKPGLNYFVGNNNCGKTSIFRSVQFIVSGGVKKDFISIGVPEEDEVSVEIVLKNVALDKTSKYFSYLEDTSFIPDRDIKLEGKFRITRNSNLKLKKEVVLSITEQSKVGLRKVGQLKLKRSSKSEKIKQNGKSKELTIKTVQVWNSKDGQFENPTGASNTITQLFDPQFIYADLRNEDLQDFGSTKPIGGLIKSISSDFQEREIYKEFETSHAKTFGTEGLLGELHQTENQINEKLIEQFGESKVHFSFELPAVTDFLKKGSISITENNIKTEASEKGNGMQRALALAIIQILSENNSKISSAQMQFFIDEPEIYLHPLAQDKLINSLKSLNQSQIFITTHSPYILRHFRNKTMDSINILSAKEGNRIMEMESLMFSKTSIGEVTYKAFGVPTIDFHQQLFTHLYLKWIDEECPSNTSLASFDDYLVVKKRLNVYPFIPRNQGQWRNEQQRTLPYIVRNEVDHPEVLEDDKNIWSEENLKQSIELMINIYNNNLKEEK